MTSGLRNPRGAVRGLGSVTLILEAVALLLALAPMVKFGGTHRHAAFVLCIVLAAVAIVLTGLLRAPWAWWAGTVVPVALIVGGFAYNWGLVGLGVIFGAAWAYVLHVRRSILSTS